MKVDVESLMDTLNAAVDHDWQQLVAANDQRPVTEGLPPFEIACQSGCAPCCTYVVGSSTPEGVRLALHVDRQPEPERQRLIDRLFAWVSEWERFARRNPIPAVTREGFDEFESAWMRATARWQVRRAACPFLATESNLCTIYPVRPGACRTHHACYPPADAALVDPPQGCFTTEADAERGRLQAVWQLNNEIGERHAEREFETFESLHLNWRPGVLGVLVLAYGEKMLGWKAGPGADNPVPTVEHALLQPAEVPAGGT